MILGQLLDREAVAKEQCDVYASALEDVYRKVAALPDSAKHKTVYMELGNKGIGEYGNSYNKDVLWGAILKNLGADNLAENATQPLSLIHISMCIRDSTCIVPAPTSMDSTASCHS